MMKQIPMSCGRVILVDDADYEHMATFKWHLSHNGYAVRRVRKDGRKLQQYFHKMLLEYEGSMDIDHADGNKLNNCRSNLRLATRTLNNANSKSRTGCSSRFKGVAWVKGYGRWWAYVNKTGKRFHIGYFDDELSAARAYNAAAIQHFGEFARLNQT